MLAVRWRGIGIGGDREIDRRCAGSVRRHARDPRRHAAARPAHTPPLWCTANELDPPDAVALWLVGFNEKLHDDRGLLRP